MWPGVPVVPFMSTGATDGLYFRQAGIPIYGVSGLFGDMDDVRAHGRDERMGVKEFFDGAGVPLVARQRAERREEYTISTPATKAQLKAGSSQSSIVLL